MIFYIREDGAADCNRVNMRIIVVQIVALTHCFYKACVKSCIVRNQHRIITAESQKFPDCLIIFWCILHHFIRNACQFYNSFGYFALWIDKRLKGVDHISILNF
ncbi:hypothetical protein SDC9_96658 [bioreactor metagenome]|uniref:Uncharacterized protein n=1 Tax=bioreactor metagenome TaxID=1076179 RepID=A0A645AJT5_9ZZZZ